MLSDRHYMRDSYDPSRNGGVSVMTWLLSAIIAGFVLQNVFLRWFNAGDFFNSYFALSPYAAASGKVWTLLTYGFLHDPRNLLHILANVLAIYFLGRELIPLLGNRRFVTVYLSAVATGGLLWLATNWQTQGLVVGASAAACGLLIIYAGFFPHRPITFLLFFILPVTLKPKHIAITLLLLDLAGFAFYEVLGAVSPFGVAHSAHLGGMLAGWVYFRYVHDRAWTFSWSRRQSKPSRRTFEADFPVDEADEPEVLPANRNLRAEVDRILDKINSEGFGALTPEEKRLLDSAKDLLSRR